MFNPKRVAKFLSKLLSVLLPVLGIIFILGLGARLVHRRAEGLAQLTSWQFWLIVAGGTLSSLVALVAAYMLASRFAQHLYKLENLHEARGFVNRCLFGQMGFAPWLRVTGGAIDGDEDHILMRVGGPGQLVVYNDNAILLERGGQFTRVCTRIADKREYPRLERLEKIYGIVDLRPKRWVLPVGAMSKEGIPITCEAEISYQIDSEGVPPTEEVPFPASQEKIFQAATCSWFREAYEPRETRTMDWSGRLIISETAGNLRTILAHYPLDRLIGLTSLGGENAREEIRRELEEKLRDGVGKLGARILGVELGDIRIEDKVTQQWSKAWKAEWERWSTERRALGKANQAQQLESAKTRAQVMLLATITEAFQPLLARQQEVTSKLVLARLFMVLSRAPSDPLTRVNMPKEAINTLKLLKDLIV